MLLALCAMIAGSVFSSGCGNDPADTTQQVERPVFDPAPGAYAEAQSVSILCGTTEATIPLVEKALDLSSWSPAPRGSDGSST